MNRCDACVHWVPFDGKQSRGTRDQRIVRNELGLCRKIGEEKDREDPAEDGWHDSPMPPDGTLAMADDVSGLQSLRTAASFGCVLWEARCEEAMMGWRCTRRAGHEGPCAAEEAVP